MVLFPALPARAGGALDLTRLGLTAEEISGIARGPADSLSGFYAKAFEVSPDGVVSQRSIDLLDRINSARMRGLRIGNVLGFDLNGDGEISAEEIADLLKNVTGKRRAEVLSLRDGADSNGDGRIDMS